MTILLVLIPLGLGLLALAIAAFVWAVRHGQFEDLEGEAERILFDEDRPAPMPRTKDAAETPPAVPAPPGDDAERPRAASPGRER
jgi:cbb3-type cytochrome oxidase maturation protein